MNQTAHISLQIPSISKSYRNKTDRCALSCPARPPACLCFLSSAAVSAASVRRYLRMVAAVCKRFLSEISRFSSRTAKTGLFRGLAQGKGSFQRVPDNKISPSGRLESRVPRGHPPSGPSRPTVFTGIGRGGWRISDSLGGISPASGSGARLGASRSASGEAPR